ncbi:MAG: MopE-related protein [archaeon]|nr:MopE-related protein [archaeon]
MFIIDKFKKIRRATLVTAALTGFSPLLGCSESDNSSLDALVDNNIPSEGGINSNDDWSNLSDTEITDYLPVTKWDGGTLPQDATVLPEPCGRLGETEKCVVNVRDEILHYGPCAEGTRSCNGAYWSECEGFGHPKIEICDGIDNNCDGRIDESSRNSVEVIPTFSPFYDAENPEAYERIFEQCFDGNPAFLKESICTAGRRYCINGEIKEDDTCYGQVTAGREICNGIDDDCDGAIDNIFIEDPLQEGSVPLGSPCTTRPLANFADAYLGDCHPGRWACMYDPSCELDEGGKPYKPCDGIDNPVCIDEGFPADELCDYHDNDCDGETDEGVGVCDCDSPDFVMHAETCNGIDDDCDGLIDNSAPQVNAPLAFPCYHNELGEMVVLEDGGNPPEREQPCRPGFAVCEQVLNLGELVANYWDCAGEIRAMAERCNGRDDDCDGEIDEGFNGGGRVEVLFLIDISGSMRPEEVMTGIVSVTNAIQQIHGNDLQDGIINNRICYSLGIIGSDTDPLLIAPANDCVPGISEDNVNFLVAMQYFSNAGGAAGLGVFNSGNELSYDGIMDWAEDDIVRDVEWNSIVFDYDINDPNQAVFQNHRELVHINLHPDAIRYVVVFGDESGQSGRGLEEEDVANVVQRLGTIVYLVSPRQADDFPGSVVQTYDQILPRGQQACIPENEEDLCCLYNDIRETCEYHLVFERNNQQERDDIAEGLTGIVREAECVSNLPNLNEQ